MKILQHSYLLIYAIFALSCARQTTPTGGPKDSIPPNLIGSNPKHGDINFKGKTIQLTFDEAILLNNPREQLIVTPDLGKPIDARVKKNQVILTLEEDLKDNTTYSINFREAVQDITEKNPAPQLKLAFSTGNYIDSLSIAGRVTDALTLKESKDATVALFQSDTFNIFLYRPTYFTKSDSKGFFKIENLKPGAYYLYAFEDKNKNLIADSKTESYGFIQDLLQLSENIEKIEVPLVRLDSRPLRLTSARPSGTFFNIKASKSLKTYNITTTEDETMISSFGEDFSNVRVYKTFEDRDSVAIHFTALDSIDNKLDTTLYVKFQERQIKPENFELELENLQVIGTKGIIRAEIQFNKPVLTVNFDSVYYRLDSATVVPFNLQSLRWDSLRNKVYLERSFDKKLIPNETTSASPQQRQSFNSPIKRSNDKTPIGNTFYLGHAAFISIELDSSRQVIERSTPSKLEETGVLLVQVETSAPHFFVQLLTKDYAVLHTIKNLKKFNFEDLKPGDYQIRLVIDRDNDGKWDPGNFYENRPPEVVSFYVNEKKATVVNLKANWELGPLLIKG
jgi:uncharacterized protein (DUF2141 family)